MEECKYGDNLQELKIDDDYFNIITLKATSFRERDIAAETNTRKFE